MYSHFLHPVLLEAEYLLPQIMPQDAFASYFIPGIDFVVSVFLIAFFFSLLRKKQSVVSITLPQSAGHNHCPMPDPSSG